MKHTITAQNIRGGNRETINGQLIGGLVNDEARSLHRHYWISYQRILSGVNQRSRHVIGQKLNFFC